MQRRAARAPTGLINVAVRIFAFEQEWRSGWLDTTAPDVRTDQIVELPIGPRFKEHDLLAGFCQNCGKYRARRCGSDNDNIDFVAVTRVLTSADRAKATAVEYYDRNKQKLVQEASVVVLAAWSAQNPRLMLNSATDKPRLGRRRCSTRTCSRVWAPSPRNTSLTTSTTRMRTRTKARSARPSWSRGPRSVTVHSGASLMPAS